MPNQPIINLQCISNYCGWLRKENHIMKTNKTTTCIKKIIIYKQYLEFSFDSQIIYLDEIRWGIFNYFFNICTTSKKGVICIMYTKKLIGNLNLNIFQFYYIQYIIKLNPTKQFLAILLFIIGFDLIKHLFHTSQSQSISAYIVHTLSKLKIVYC